jgi:hypothetical protein
LVVDFYYYGYPTNTHSPFKSWILLLATRLVMPHYSSYAAWLGKSVIAMPVDCSALWYALDEVSGYAIGTVVQIAAAVV